MARATQRRGVTPVLVTPVAAIRCNDHTHFEAAGARQIAGLVADAVRTQNIPLRAYLR